MTAVQAISCNASILKAILLGSRIVSSCHVINNQKQQSKVIGPCRGRFPLRLDMSPPFYFSKVFPIQNSRRVRFSQLAGHTFYAGQIKPRRFRFSLVIAASIWPAVGGSESCGRQLETLQVTVNCQRWGWTKFHDSLPARYSTENAGRGVPQY